MKSNEVKAAAHSDARPAVMRLTLAGVLAVGLAACGGGGGGDDSSDDSKDLRAALERLEAGMTYDEVVAAVGWELNETRNVWSHVDQNQPALARRRRLIRLECHVLCLPFACTGVATRR